MLHPASLSHSHFIDWIWQSLSVLILIFVKIKLYKRNSIVDEYCYITRPMRRGWDGDIVFSIILMHFMRSIVLKNGIVTHYLGTNFWRKSLAFLKEEKKNQLKIFYGEIHFPGKMDKIYHHSGIFIKIKIKN
jgi:hypothetical protein